MKFINTYLALFIFVLACSICLAQEDTGVKRPVLPRRPIVGKGAAKTTTTTAAPAPAEGEDGDYAEEGVDQYGDELEEEAAASSSTTTTTTEAPKKIGPVIRPFRSNDDLLNSLKRRQMNAKKNKIEKPTPKPKIAAVANDEEEEEEPAAAAAPAKTFKSNPALNRRKFTKPGKAEAPAEDVATAESEQAKEETRPKRPQPAISPIRRRN